MSSSKRTEPTEFFKIIKSEQDKNLVIKRSLDEVRERLPIDLILHPNRWAQNEDTHGMIVAGHMTVIRQVNLDNSATVVYDTYSGEPIMRSWSPNSDPSTCRITSLMPHGNLSKAVPLILKLCRVKAQGSETLKKLYILRGDQLEVPVILSAVNQEDTSVGRITKIVQKSRLSSDLELRVVFSSGLQLYMDIEDGKLQVMPMDGHEPVKDMYDAEIRLVDTYTTRAFDVLTRTPSSYGGYLGSLGDTIDTVRVSGQTTAKMKHYLPLLGIRRRSYFNANYDSLATPITQGLNIETNAHY